MRERPLLPPPPSEPPSLDDDFSRAELRPDLWVAHYLPHWTVAERSRARFERTADGLQLRIDADQPDWRPEDAPLRVSNLQTGTFSGEQGSTRGTHRHRPDGLLVRTATPRRLLWAPSSGRVDVTLSASTDEGCMVAVWLVGTEHESPEDAGEICVVEIDASAVGATGTRVRTGIKAHGDPRLRTDMSELEVPFDASGPHTWTAIWNEGGMVLGCDGGELRRLPQALSYPLFLMIDLFELGDRGPDGRYPKTASIHRVRGWSGETGPRTGGRRGD